MRGNLDIWLVGLGVGVLTIALIVVSFFSGKTQMATSSGLNPKETRQIETVIRDYLMEHPEVLYDALNNVNAHMEELQGRAAQDAIARFRKELEGNEHDFVAGNPKGDVTVVEFFDYNCGYCKLTVDTLMQLIEEDKNVRVVFKEMPILAESSTTAARAAIAANKQGKYLPFHLALLHSQGALSDGRIVEIASGVGIDTRAVLKEMNAGYVNDVIKANHELAEALGVRGTPGFIVGDEVVPGAIDIDRMKELVAKAREKCVTC